MKDLMNRFEELIISDHELRSHRDEWAIREINYLKDIKDLKELNTTFCDMIKERDKEKAFLCAELDRYIDKYGDINIKITGELDAN